MRIADHSYFVQHAQSMVCVFRMTLDVYEGPEFKIQVERHHAPVRDQRIRDEFSFLALRHAVLVMSIYVAKFLKANTNQLFLRTENGHFEALDSVEEELLAFTQDIQGKSG